MPSHYPIITNPIVKFKKTNLKLSISIARYLNTREKFEGSSSSLHQFYISQQEYNTFQNYLYTLLNQTNSTELLIYVK